MERIDVLGQPCPIPVIKAKEALMKSTSKEVLVLVDNIVAVQNLEKMAVGTGYQFRYDKKTDNHFEVRIQKSGQVPNSSTEVEKSDQEASSESAISSAAGSGLVVAISRETMGAGAEELGKILIKGFIFSLTALAEPPTYVLFFNGGAHLTTQNANTIEDLRALEQKGTKILTCGTCSNYYGLTDKLGVGEITDMYGITQAMALAAKVINI